MLEENTGETSPKPTKIEMPSQNGITMPKDGTNCSNIWKAADAMSAEIKAPVAVGDLMVKLVANGYNEATIKTQYARWRKFHGVTGRVGSEKARAQKAEREAAKIAKEQEREAKKKAREEEKARKAAEREAAKAAKAAEKQAKIEAKAKEKAEKLAAKAEAEAQAQANDAQAS